MNGKSSNVQTSRGALALYLSPARADTNNPATVPAALPARFYRLSKP
jgi:hypothetical protein